MTKKRDEMVRLAVPHSALEVLRRRLQPLIRRCTRRENILDSIALSCYVQGVHDTMLALEQRPEVMAEYLRHLQDERAKD